MNTPFADLAGTVVGRRVREVLVRLLAAELARDGTFVADPEQLLDEMCPRILLLSGVVTPQVAQALVDALNGRWTRSARRLVAGLPMLLARAAAAARARRPRT